jgi:hypothetical protein
MGVKLGLLHREPHRLWVFENRVQGKTFGSKVEVRGDWRIFHNAELHDLYSFPSTVWMVKSSSMGWAGHVARMEQGFYSNLEGKETRGIMCVN